MDTKRDVVLRNRRVDIHNAHTSAVQLVKGTQRSMLHLTKRRATSACWKGSLFATAMKLLGCSRISTPKVMERASAVPTFSLVPFQEAGDCPRAMIGGWCAAPDGVPVEHYFDVPVGGQGEGACRKNTRAGGSAMRQPLHRRA